MTTYTTKTRKNSNGQVLGRLNIPVYIEETKPEQPKLPKPQMIEVTLKQIRTILQQYDPAPITIMRNPDDYVERVSNGRKRRLAYSLVYSLPPKTSLKKVKMIAETYLKCLTTGQFKGGGFQFEQADKDYFMNVVENFFHQRVGHEKSKEEKKNEQE